MKKTAYIVIGSLLIALVLLISGTMMSGFSELGTLYDQGNLGNDIPIVKTMSITEEFRDIKNLKIKAVAGTVEIIEYAGDVIRVEAKNVSTKTKLSKEHDTLVIKNTFKFWNVFNITNVATKVKVYVPNSYEFDKVELDIDAGKCTVPMLKANSVDVDVNAGDFEANNIITSYIKLDVDAGNANIDLLNSYTSEFDADMGDIDVTMVGSESDYSYNIKCDVGDATVGSYRCDGVSDKYNHHGGQRSIEVDCDAGSVTVNMEV